MSSVTGFLAVVLADGVVITVLWNGREGRDVPPAPTASASGPRHLQPDVDIGQQEPPQHDLPPSGILGAAGVLADTSGKSFVSRATAHPSAGAAATGRVSRAAGLGTP